MVDFAPPPEEIADTVRRAHGPPVEGGLALHFPADAAMLQAACLEVSGHFLAADWRAMSCVAPDGRHVTLALHRFTSTGDADLVALGGLGLMRREVRLAFLSWAFAVIGVRRVTLRIPAGSRRLQDFARRLAFAHEGTSREFYADGIDASIWGLTLADALASVGRGPEPAPAPSNRKLN